jgi:hypothetical protein
MDIVEVLSLPINKSPYFVVDTTGPKSVKIQIPVLGAGLFATLQNSLQYSVFQAGDNFAVLSLGYVLPEAFVMAQAPSASTIKIPSIALSALQGGITPIPLPISGLTGISVPMENFENAINAFSDIVPVTAGTFGLTAQFVQDVTAGHEQQVSMIGVPSSLNATTQVVTVFAKIMHNLPMVNSY